LNDKNNKGCKILTRRMSEEKKTKRRQKAP
jgi:hypothetical protein